MRKAGWLGAGVPSQHFFVDFDAPILSKDPGWRAMRDTFKENVNAAPIYYLCDGRLLKNLR
jgi:hypothetical protein